MFLYSLQDIRRFFAAPLKKFYLLIWLAWAINPPPQMWVVSSVSVEKNSSSKFAPVEFTDNETVSDALDKWASKLDDKAFPSRIFSDWVRHTRRNCSTRNWITESGSAWKYNKVDFWSSAAEILINFNGPENISF